MPKGLIAVIVIAAVFVVQFFVQRYMRTRYDYECGRCRAAFSPTALFAGSGPSPARGQQVHALSPVRYAFLGHARAEGLASPDAMDRVQFVMTAYEAGLVSASR